MEPLPTASRGDGDCLVPQQAPNETCQRPARRRTRIEVQRVAFAPNARKTSVGPSAVLDATNQSGTESRRAVGSQSRLVPGDRARSEEPSKLYKSEDGTLSTTLASRAPHPAQGGSPNFGRAPRSRAGQRSTASSQPTPRVTSTPAGSTSALPPARAAKRALRDDRHARAGSARNAYGIFRNNVTTSTRVHRASLRARGRRISTAFDTMAAPATQPSRPSGSLVRGASPRNASNQYRWTHQPRFVLRQCRSDPASTDTDWNSHRPS